MKTVLLIAFFLCFLSPSLQSQPGVDLSVRVSASTQDIPPYIKLTWLRDTKATAYRVFRKSTESFSWGSPVASLTGTDTSYSDATAQLGTAYEYLIAKTMTGSSAGTNGYGYIYAGADVMPTEFRGTIMLIIEQSVTIPLSAEIERLENDLRGDGWNVLRFAVSSTASVSSVKSIITSEFANNSDLKSVFLLGHVPVPYSGYIAPDGHVDHGGAWPADGFYGEMDGFWSDTNVDTRVDTTTATRVANKNFPGDGKYDQNSFPSDVDIAVGRVDFWNMPAFGVSEVELLRRYLDKNHRWRTGKMNVARRGLIDDNFQGYAEGFSATGWRSFSATLGYNNVIANKYFAEMKKQSYLLSFGCGGGNFTSASGVGSTTDFAKDTLQSVFTFLFGSYFGDWNVENSFLRAPLASNSWILTNAWGGRPHWYIHRMGLGGTIGESALLSQNNSSTYSPNNSQRGVHIALMGDPTLRMHVVPPPFSALATAENSFGAVRLSWTQGDTSDIIGYYIYRAQKSDGVLKRINNVIVKDRIFFDTVPRSGNYLYSVRAVKHEQSGSGSYVNLSQGALAEISAVISDVADDVQSEQNALHIAPNPVKDFCRIDCAGQQGDVLLTILDALGREVYRATRDIRSEGGGIKIDTRGFSAGTYLVQMHSSSGILHRKLLIR